MFFIHHDQFKMTAIIRTYTLYTSSSQLYRDTYPPGKKVILEARSPGKISQLKKTPADDSIMIFTSLPTS